MDAVLFAMKEAIWCKSSEWGRKLGDSCQRNGILAYRRRNTQKPCKNPCRDYSRQKTVCVKLPTVQLLVVSLRSKIWRNLAGYRNIQCLEALTVNEKQASPDVACQLSRWEQCLCYPQREDNAWLQLSIGTPGAIRTGLLALPAGVCNSPEHLVPKHSQNQLLHELVTTKSMGWCSSPGHSPRCWEASVPSGTAAQPLSLSPYLLSPCQETGQGLLSHNRVLGFHSGCKGQSVKSFEQVVEQEIWLVFRHSTLLDE